MDLMDLHTHSCYSDGTLGPEEIVMQAKARGLQAVAISDHDTMEGTAMALEAGRRHGIRVVPAVEISTREDGASMHVLGYGFDHKDQALADRLATIQESRKQRNLAILHRLRHMGYDVHEHDLDKVSAVGQAGRPHIARLLVDRKVVSCLGEAFERFLGKQGAAYVPRARNTTAREAIDCIHRAGGVAVLAHPGQLVNGKERAHGRGARLRDFIAPLREQGLDGLEVYYPTHSRAMRKALVKIAREMDMIVTGGSDFHGGNKRNKLGGAGAPACLLRGLDERLALRRNREAA